MNKDIAEEHIDEVGFGGLFFARETTKVRAF